MRKHAFYFFIFLLALLFIPRAAAAQLYVLQYDAEGQGTFQKNIDGSIITYYYGRNVAPEQLSQPYDDLENDLTEADYTGDATADYFRGNFGTGGPVYFHGNGTGLGTTYTHGYIKHYGRVYLH